MEYVAVVLNELGRTIATLYDRNEQLQQALDQTVSELTAARAESADLRSQLAGRGDR